MNPKIQLSICITTYNRAEFIGTTLDSIINQANEHVEIVVVDGASTDHTADIVYQYQKRFPRLRYLIEKTNTGVDRGFCQAVELAIGKYCWLMSDDDVLKPGALQTVLNETFQNYGLIIVNAEVKNEDLSVVLTSKRLSRNNNQVYKPTEEQLFFIENADYLSFIGCVVIKKQLWQIRNKENYLGTDFIHVGVIFQNPINEDILVIAEPLISIRYGNAHWTPKGFEIWMFKWPKLIWSFTFFSDWAKNQVCSKEPWRKLTTLLLYRALGSFSNKEYKTKIKPQAISLLHKLAAQIIAYAPGQIVNTLWVILLSLTHNKSHPLLVDVKKSRFYIFKKRL